MGRTIPWVVKCPPDVAERIAELRSLELLVLQELGPCRFLVRDPRMPSRPCRVTIGDIQMCSCSLPGGRGAGARAPSHQRRRNHPQVEASGDATTAAAPPQSSPTGGASGGTTAPAARAPARQTGGVRLCDHILFVMHRVFRLPTTNPLLWQLSLLEAEIEQLVASRGAALLHRRGGAGGLAPAASAADVEGAAPVEQRPIGAEDTCPVCCENLLPPAASSPAAAATSSTSAQTALVWCQRGCGNSVHLSCFRQYAAHHAGGTLNCPLCRVPWGAASTAAAHGGAVGGAGGHCSAVCSECRRGIADNVVRYKCAFCPTYSLCAGCFANPLLHPQHPFDRMATHRSLPEPATRPLPPPPMTQPTVADDGSVSISAAQALRVLEGGGSGANSASSPNGRTGGGGAGASGHLPPELLALADRDITPEDYDLLLRLDQHVAPARRNTLYAYEVRALPTHVVPAYNTSGAALDQDTTNAVVTATTHQQGDEVEGTPPVEVPCACAICLDVPDPGSVLVELPACGHRFHRDCAMQWLTQSRAACPIDNIEVAPPIHAVPDDIDFLARAAAVAGSHRSHASATTAAASSGLATAAPTTSSSVTPGIAAAVAARHPRPGIAGGGTTGTRRPPSLGHPVARSAAQPPAAASVQLGVVGVGGGNGTGSTPSALTNGRRPPPVNGITQRLLDAAAARRAFETAAVPDLVVAASSDIIVDPRGGPSAAPPAAPRTRAASSGVASVSAGRATGGAPQSIGRLAHHRPAAAVVRGVATGGGSGAAVPNNTPASSAPELFVWSAAGGRPPATVELPRSSGSSGSHSLRPGIGPTARQLPPRHLPPMPPATAPAAPLATRLPLDGAAPTAHRAGSWRRSGGRGAASAGTPPPTAALHPPAAPLYVGLAPLPIAPTSAAAGGAPGNATTVRPGAALQQQRLRRAQAQANIGEGVRVVGGSDASVSLMAPTVFGVVADASSATDATTGARNGAFLFHA